MLEITGEYILMKDTVPDIPWWKDKLSYLKAQKLHGTSEGADFVRYLWFESTWTLRKGYIRGVERKLVRTQDLREKNKEDGLAYE